MFGKCARIRLDVIAFGAAIACAVPTVLAEDAPGGAAASQPAKPVFKGDPYLLDVDPVTRDKLPAEPLIKLIDGREFRFADQKSLDKFKAKPGDYLPKVDALMIRQQKPFYALETCPVSGEKLGGMGKPVDRIYKNRLVRFCCSGCVESFEKDPARYIAKINEAVIAKQKPTYPLATCVVSGEKLGGMGKAVDYVAGNRLVRFCCSGCIEKFEKTPLKFIKMLDEAAKTKTADSKPAQAGGR